MLTCLLSHLLTHSFACLTSPFTDRSSSSRRQWMPYTYPLSFHSGFSKLTPTRRLCRLYPQIRWRTGMSALPEYNVADRNVGAPRLDLLTHSFACLTSPFTDRSSSSRRQWMPYTYPLSFHSGFSKLTPTRRLCRLYPQIRWRTGMSALPES